MRKIIASLQVSLDGFIEGPNGEMDWVMEDDEEAWNDLDEELSASDTFILGRIMYPAYEQFWLAILSNPKAVLSLTGKTPTKNEIAFAQLADKTQHIVVSKTLKKVDWQAVRVVPSTEEIRKLKQQPGKDMLVWGGGTLISSLLNDGLIDELHLMVTPLILAGGKPLFKNIETRRALKLIKTKSLKSGKVSLLYKVL